MDILFEFPLENVVSNLIFFRQLYHAWLNSVLRLLAGGNSIKGLLHSIHTILSINYQCQLSQDLQIPSCFQFSLLKKEKQGSMNFTKRFWHTHREAPKIKCFSMKLKLEKNPLCKGHSFELSSSHFEWTKDLHTHALIRVTINDFCATEKSLSKAKMLMFALSTH